MGLKLIVDTLEEIDEKHRDLYELKDGKYHLIVEGLEDTTGLKTALRKEREARDALDKKVKAWERAGKTPEEIEELIAKAAEAEEEKLRSAGQWDKLKDQMNEKHAKEIKGLKDQIAAKDNEIGTVKKSLEAHLVDAQATAAIAANKGTAKLLLPHVQRHVRVIEKDGKYVTQVVDEKGDPRVDSKGNPLTIEQFVAEMRDDDVYGRAFEGNGQSGGGTPPGGGNGGGGNPSKTRRSELKTEKDRADFIDAHGLDAYRSLPA